MSTGSAITYIECRNCESQYALDVTEYPCEQCGGILDPQYDLGRVDLDPGELETRETTIWAYRELLPIRDRSAIVSLGAGGTPLVDCPTLADRLGVAHLLVKDEGQNPTNTFKDRGQATAMSAAVERDVEAVALPSAGNAGQAASAYAARAGLECHVYLNHQAGQLQKDFVEAHGAHLHLVEGKIEQAAAAFEQARDRYDWTSVATFQTPFRHEGKKTMGYELFEALDWSIPDEIVYPTGGGVGLIGMWKAYQELSEMGWISESPPRLTVAQSAGVAPIVEAIHGNRDRHQRVSTPNTIATGVEIPDPGASPWILEAVSETNGAGVAVEDDAAIDAAVRTARSDGVEMCVTSAVALAGAIRRAEDGCYDGDETIVVINTGAGAKTPSPIGARARDPR